MNSSATQPKIERPAGCAPELAPLADIFDDIARENQRARAGKTGVAVTALSQKGSQPLAARPGLAA